jgi:hypothetical protein
VLLSTLTHQPDYRTDFHAYAEYVTTTSFLVSHLVGSILGTAIGIFGVLALGAVLATSGVRRLALRAGQSPADARSRQASPTKRI